MYNKQWAVGQQCVKRCLRGISSGKKVRGGVRLVHILLRF
jgi:hypothetical protein